MAQAHELVARFREMIAVRRRYRRRRTIRWSAVIVTAFALGFLAAMVWFGGAK
jgi:hypothetical protein